jgi:hypothetical protein
MSADESGASSTLQIFRAFGFNGFARNRSFLQLSTLFGWIGWLICRPFTNTVGKSLSYRCRNYSGRSWWWGWSQDPPKADCEKCGSDSRKDLLILCKLSRRNILKSWGYLFNEGGLVGKTFCIASSAQSRLISFRGSAAVATHAVTLIKCWVALKSSLTT